MQTNYKNLVGIPQEKGPLCKSEYRWDNNIELDLRDIRRGDMDRFDCLPLAITPLGEP
jgi:hypothetical protein